MLNCDVTGPLPERSQKGTPVAKGIYELPRSSSMDSDCQGILPPDLLRKMSSALEADLLRMGSGSSEIFDMAGPITTFEVPPLLHRGTQGE